MLLEGRRGNVRERCLTDRRRAPAEESFGNRRVQPQNIEQLRTAIKTDWCTILFFAITAEKTALEGKAIPR